MSRPRPPAGTYARMAAALLQARGARSQAAVARDAGMTPASLCCYETGRSLPSDAALRRLAVVLGADGGALLLLAREEADQACVRGERAGGCRSSARAFAAPAATPRRLDRARRLALIRAAAARAAARRSAS